MGMESLVWYGMELWILSTRDRHLSSCNVESYLPTYLSDASRIQRIGHACLSSTHLFQLVPSITYSTNMAGESTYRVIVREIARSWHNYFTLVVLVKRGGGGRGHYCSK